eukprot:15216-Prymnesium_polylepis.2
MLTREAVKRQGDHLIHADPVPHKVVFVEAASARFAHEAVRVPAAQRHAHQSIPRRLANSRQLAWHGRRRPV